VRREILVKTETANWQRECPVIIALKFVLKEYAELILECFASQIFTGLQSG
jgi:hypothetical protein